MVVFTCSHCGESVQKPKVEKHYLTKCRNKSPNLSCMDCFKDFLGNDYEAHIKCVTEEERYSGKGFTAKEKKGEKKQTAWVDMIQSVLDEQKNASSNVIRIIETISKHNNTPRKKPKFINFVKNVCGNKTNIKDIDQAWEIISVKLTALSSLNAQNINKKKGDKTNEDSVSEEKQNGDIINSVENGKEINGDVVENGKDTNGEILENGKENGVDKEEDDKVVQNGDKLELKLSKKQRKEEKKRRKYEAELQSVEAAPEVIQEEEVVVPKKGKKNKNKGDNTHNQEDVKAQEEMDKNKKRKRQDTVTAPEVQENEENLSENVPMKEKTIKKKLRKDSKREAEVEKDESICLHDQNVARSENEVLECNGNNGKFNWHEVIISLLQKKGNELPFKRLQKKVLGEYSEYTGCEVDDRIADKFIKKLKSAPNVRVDKNRVLLIEE